MTERLPAAEQASTAEPPYPPPMASRPWPASRPLPMTPGRWMALAIGVPVALLIIGWTALTLISWTGQSSYRVNLRIPVHGRAVALAVDSGQVSIGPGEPGLVRVRGTAHYAFTRPAIRWQATPVATTVRSSCHSLTGPCSLDIGVTIPAGLTTAVSDSSGDLTASHLRGQVTLKDQSGEIRASAIAGRLLISDQSGDITVAGLSGPDLTVEDQSGTISAVGLTEPVVTVTNSSGDITLEFAHVPTRVQVTCESGDVHLVLPPGGTAYQVDAHTSSGSTSVRVPTDPSSPHLITVSDQSGDVSITR